MPSAHIDSFVRDRVPPPDRLPGLLFELPALQFGEQLNCASELLDRWVAQGQGARLAVLGAAPDGTPIRWSYAELHAQANRIANVLVNDLGLVPGNRVLLRGANSPMLAACWFGVVKAGGIAVGTMPLLRARELTGIVAKAEITHALVDARLAEEISLARLLCPTLAHVLHFNGGADGGLEQEMTRQAASFDNVDTAADDTCVVAFTSGTTGQPKAALHFHRDVMAACACWPPHVLRAEPGDRIIGSPPLAFTFGLGGLLLFPMSIGAASVLVEKASPDALPAAIEQYRATICYTSPTAYRAMAGQLGGHDISSLRKCVSAGEALPAATRQLWRETTGIQMIDGIGSTDLPWRQHRGTSPRWRHRVRRSRLPGVRARRRRQGVASRAGRPPGSARPDRLQVPRR
jgi:2-aminobenzoate-CoA ligase